MHIPHIRNHLSATVWSPQRNRALQLGVSQTIFDPFVRYTVPLTAPPFLRMIRHYNRPRNTTHDEFIGKTLNLYFTHATILNCINKRDHFVPCFRVQIISSVSAID